MMQIPKRPAAATPSVKKKFALAFWLPYATAFPNGTVKG